MLADSQSSKNENQAASSSDYAAQDFEAALTQEKAHQFGSEVLFDQNISMRVAAITLTKSKTDLVQCFSGSDEGMECLMTTIEKLQELEDFIKSLSDMTEQAIVRLLCTAYPKPLP